MNVKTASLNTSVSSSIANLKSKVTTNEQLLNLLLADIEEDPNNPRRNFAKDEIDELSESMRLHGLVQPIVVREISPGQYRLIAGARRLRAAKKLKWERISAIKKSDTKQLSAVQLVENIQRADLAPLEIAQTLKTMLEDKANYPTAVSLAEKLGKSKSWVSRHLSLLNLSSDVAELAREKVIERTNTLLEIDKLPDQKRAEVVQSIKDGKSVAEAMGNQKATVKTMLAMEADEEVEASQVEMERYAQQLSKLLSLPRPEVRCDKGKAKARVLFNLTQEQIMRALSVVARR